MQLLELAMAGLVTILLMVIHELPKSLVYLILCESEQRRNYSKSAWKLQRYVDPIGLVLSVACCAGFSKPMMYMVRSKRTNLCMGISGLLSLSGVFLLSVWKLRVDYHMNSLDVTQVGLFQIAGQLFWIYATILSAGMLLANLFPVSVFDMGLIIAGLSSKKYLVLVACDTLIKCLLMLGVGFGVVKYGAFQMINGLLAV